MSTLKQVIYVSDRAPQTTNEDIELILQASERHNLQNQIKGILISLPEHFYQVIEGPAQAIDSLLHKLKKDRRHHSIRIFSDKTVQAYEFGKWAMIHHEIDEEYEDYFWVLSRYASDIQLKNASTSGIEMLLKGFSN